MDAQHETSHPLPYDFYSSMQNQYNPSTILLSKALYKQADMFRSAEEKSDDEELKDSRKAKGPTETFLPFFENVFSAMTLGFYQPDNKPAPTGVARVIDPVKKLVWDAPKSLLYDTPSSIVYTIMGEEEKQKEPSTSKITQR